MKRVLLCRPHFFQVDYQINPWMKVGSVDRINALIQWENLVLQYQKLGVEVEFIDQIENHPDMVFAADQGLLLEEKHILLSSFRFPERRGESEYYRSWYREHGYQITPLPDDLYFEGGGELQRWRDYLFIGVGFRTDHYSARHVGAIFDKEVLCLELIKEHFYHLDTCLMVLDDETVFYYPEAFSAKSIRDLKSLIPNLLEIEESEVRKFAANSVMVGHTVLMQSGNPQMAHQINDLGHRIVTLDVSEFMKAGGGLHCLTGNLAD